MIERVDIQKLSKKDFETLQSLCYLPNEGYMAMQLEFCYLACNKYKKTDFVCEIILYKIQNQIVAWCIAQDLVYKYSDYVDVGIFVHPDFRGKGIASQILEHLLKDSMFKYSAWIGTDVNLKLYKKFKDRITLFDMNHYALTECYKKFCFD